MAISAFAKSRLQTISDSGFARAKKLADLAIKKNVDGKGNTTARGYEQAIEILNPFLVSDKGNVAVDAERLVVGYENKFTKLQAKRNKLNRTIGQFKVDEREIFFVSPSSGNRVDIMRDIPNMVSQISEELSLHVFSVENAIEEARLNNESSAELETYLFSVNKRARMMSELHNDYLNDEIIPGEILNGYGVYVDSDPNDGEMLGVMVAPIGDLPSGIDSSIFRQVDSSVDVGGGYIPLFGRATTDGMGLHSVRIGNQVWEGLGALELQYSKKRSDAPQFKNDPGEFSLSGVLDKGTSMRRGSFSKGFTGFDDEGNPVQTTFFAGQDDKIYSLDDESLGLFESDPMLSQDLSRATQLESSFAKNLLQSQDVEPLRDIPQTAAGARRAEEEKLVPIRAEEERRKELGFFGRAREDFAKRRTERESQPKQPSFFGSKNKPTTPDEPVIGESTPDIVEQGKGFFRNNPFTKPFVDFLKK